jgi:hypothetical protein
MATAWRGGIDVCIIRSNGVLKRTGLIWRGSALSDEWHVQHLTNPQSVESRKA